MFAQDPGAKSTQDPSLFHGPSSEPSAHEPLSLPDVVPELAPLPFVGGPTLAAPPPELYDHWADSTPELQPVTAPAQGGKQEEDKSVAKALQTTDAVDDTVGWYEHRQKKAQEKKQAEKDKARKERQEEQRQAREQRKAERERRAAQSAETAEAGGEQQGPKKRNKNGKRGAQKAAAEPAAKVAETPHAAPDGKAASAAPEGRPVNKAAAADGKPAAKAAHADAPSGAKAGKAAKGSKAAKAARRLPPAHNPPLRFNNPMKVLGDTGKTVRKFGGPVLDVATSAIAAYERYQETPAQTTLGKSTAAGLAGGLNFAFNKNPVTAGMLGVEGLLSTGAGLLGASEQTQKNMQIFGNGISSVSDVAPALAEMYFGDKDTTATAGFHEKSLQGDYGWVMKQASQAGDFWAEAGLGGGLQMAWDALWGDDD